MCTQLWENTKFISFTLVKLMSIRLFNCLFLFLLEKRTIFHLLTYDNCYQIVSLIKYSKHEYNKVMECYCNPSLCNNFRRLFCNRLAIYNINMSDNKQAKQQDKTHIVRYIGISISFQQTLYTISKASSCCYYQWSWLTSIDISTSLQHGMWTIHQINWNLCSSQE